ncbi:3-hydroxyacyl-CoA dehydrogenase NAD-binding domain-containing protein [Rhodococcus koreensis]|uniref:Short chain enoyl-CoA hydratase /3-hydroxyacyl-CoA dehydrogenase n=1 Tax=Rhodococcus koreensis TaxID=99653 RepID=A0A1H4WBB2_9NOCA|nr:3-hydroxyacyl-CoA dehydrogenase NAD-binding domain-containing protein [Rhodococcus koreensis]SEC89941.1 short chain enoyl-CoA hydratase /3-hydroxyacyl-CoA dehydrogenase [Rhodococcus koreensis]
MSTQYSVVGSVAIIHLDNPPLNGLSLSTRQGILRDFTRALDAPGIDSIVLTGNAADFSAGADISEVAAPRSAAGPSLRELIEAFEDSSKPVVAAIEGTCFGGGLELALGAHYRVAATTAKVALPDVKLGLVPGAGGTQRLPRALDMRTAADMITGGSTRTAGSLAAIPGQKLFDLVVDADTVTAATRFATRMAASGRRPRIRDLVAAEGDDLGTLHTQLTKRSRGFAAPLIALDLVERARGPFTEGLDAEQAAFLELVGSDQSAALRHAFFAERTARRIPGMAAGTVARPVQKVAVVGAGTMGGGIAMNFLDADIPVAMLETSQEPLDRGLATIRRNYQSQVNRGKLTPEALERRMGLLDPTVDYADLADCDLVIEAVFEDMDVKRVVFTKLDEVMKRGAILASNTSTLDVDVIAEFTGRPADVVGMHFFSPANVMTLLEIVRADKTADDVLATASALGRRVGKVTVVAGVCDGFIGNRMLARYRRASDRLLEVGASPEQIDSAMEGFGYAMGPYRAGDLAGGDIGWAIRKRRYAENPAAPRNELADRLCEMGRFGQKTGAGWYDYEPGRRDAIPSPVVAALLESHYRDTGIRRQNFSAEEIVQRLVFALVDEGARILDEGIALRASDIDVVYLAGYGFPRHRGGPMFHADGVGLDRVEEALRRFDESTEPAPLLTRLAKEGRTFN